MAAAAAAAPDAFETTLLIHPRVLGDFLDYNDFLDVADCGCKANATDEHPLSVAQPVDGCGGQGGLVVCVIAQGRSGRGDPQRRARGPGAAGVLGRDDRHGGQRILQAGGRIAEVSDRSRGKYEHIPFSPPE